MEKYLENLKIMKKEKLDTTKLLLVDIFKYQLEKEELQKAVDFAYEFGNDRKIKYGMTVGYEGEGKHKEFEIVSAREYMEAYQGDLDYIKENIKTEKDKEEYLELLATIEKQLIFTEDFEVMTQQEFEDMFKQEYKYEDCGVKAPMPLF